MCASTMEDEDLDSGSEGGDEDSEFRPLDDNEDYDDLDPHHVDEVADAHLTLPMVAKDNIRGLIPSLQGRKEHTRIPMWLDKDYKTACQAL